MIRNFLCILFLTTGVVRAAEPLPGNNVFGAQQYVEYTPGDLPLILAAPHGGRLTPEEIPDRPQGVRESDANTQELARTVAAVIHARTGRHAHLVICRLHRGKLDANRDIGEAAFGNPLAEQAWQEHHGFIAQACAAAVEKFGAAFLIDLHGHAHPGQRLELGYLHTAEELAQDEPALNAPEFAAAGSLHLLTTRSPVPYAELLRGASSLGALLEAGGFRATPSPSAPHPLVPYFRGGYTVARHCRAEAKVAGLQIECHRIGVRDTAENRLAFAEALATALETFLPTYLGVTLKGEKRPGDAVSPVQSAAQ